MMMMKMKVMLYEMNSVAVLFLLLLFCMYYYQLYKNK